MGGHSLAARLHAVMCFAMAKLSLSGAILLFKQTWNAQKEEKVNHVKSFIALSYHRLSTTYSLRDFPRSGRRKLVSNEVVLKCADEFKSGYTRNTVIDEGTGQVGLEHKYYSTIYQACQENEYIGKIVNKYNISPKHLLARMHAVCPSIKRMRLEYKLQLTVQNMEDRREAAVTLLRHIDNDARLQPPPSAFYLERIFWVDEWHVWLTPNDCAQYIWADAFDQHAHSVLPIPQLKRGEQPRVLRCLAVVNAVLGPVHIEFTTGTDNLQRDLNKHDDAANPYHVSASSTA